ncbi:MAG: NRDE family protein, partial [Acidobacteriota bacterium]
MCTLTVNREDHRLLVAMNRDERWGRAQELPPSVHPGERAWLAPLDGEKNGTWMGVNDDGVAACLLNGYHPGDFDLFLRDDVPSRGEIIPRLMALSGREVEDWLRHGLEVDRYPSFTLLVWTRDHSWELQWQLDRERTLRPAEPGWRMFSSSAWRTDEVLGWRSDRFKEWLEAGRPFDGPLPSYNLLEAEGLSEWSPWMTRSFSATRS